jgi:cleavage and polyadenylation specificity factor subunit 4
VRRDPRVNDRNDRYSAGSEQGKGQEMPSPGGGQDDETQYQHGFKAHHEDQYGAGNNFRNDESESEDEAPRRSRHGEGKKKRRGSEGDATTASDH